MEHATTADRVAALAAPIAAAEGLELVHVELRGTGSSRMLRVFLDRPGGITHADCERVSRELGATLDADNILEGAYTLEVSSPGLDRPLVKAEDFQRFAGQKVKLETREPLAGRKRFSGKLEGWREGAVVLAVEPAGELAIPLGMIDKARLAPEWPGPAAKPGKAGKGGGKRR